MTALALQWFWWIFATFGIVGIIALWIFAPAAAAVALKAVVGFFKIVFGYRIGCAIVAAVVAFAIADYHRARIDEADWQRQIAEFNAAQAERDKQIDADARAQVRKEIADEQAAVVVADKQEKTFEDALPVIPAVAGCPSFTVGADADKLRAIAGRPPSSKRKFRLPKLTRKRVTS